MIFFVGLLKAIDKKSRIRNKIRIWKSVVWISGSIPKYLGFTTLLVFCAGIIKVTSTVWVKSSRPRDRWLFTRAFWHSISGKLIWQQFLLFVLYLKQNKWNCHLLITLSYSHILSSSSVSVVFQANFLFQDWTTQFPHAGVLAPFAGFDRQPSDLVCRCSHDKKLTAINMATFHLRGRYQ